MLKYRLECDLSESDLSYTYALADIGRIYRTIDDDKFKSYVPSKLQMYARADRSCNERTQENLQSAHNFSFKKCFCT